jgi:CheY-like chemotaxis protein
MNQEVVCEHLTRVGIRTAVADNGKIGVDMVAERVKTNQKPFDLIFMDMYMPVMDGMEAASKIIALNTGSPLVAMTANVMASELEKYRSYGMPDCLGKPFTSQELWRTLLNYLVPVGSGALDDYDCDNELQKKLRIYFYANNQGIHTEITEAIDAGDIVLAHRLAHSLKGNAGQIGKTELQVIARKIESLLNDGIIPPKEDINNLKNELMLVLEDLKPLYNESAQKETSHSLSAGYVLSLFEKLGIMLEKLNPECIELLDEIRAIPDAGELAQQVDDFEFESAAKTLAELKKKWIL